MINIINCLLSQTERQLTILTNNITSGFIPHISRELAAEGVAFIKTLWARITRLQHLRNEQENKIAKIKTRQQQQNGAAMDNTELAQLEEACAILTNIKMNMAALLELRSLVESNRLQECLSISTANPLNGGLSAIQAFSVAAQFGKVPEVKSRLEELGMILEHICSQVRSDACLNA